jgi:hypothetical protein
MDRSVRTLLIGVLLVDLARRRLGDADRVGTRHGFLQTLLKLPLQRIVRLLVRGLVLHVRIAATLLDRGMRHEMLLLMNSLVMTTPRRPVAFPAGKEARFGAVFVLSIERFEDGHSG